MVSMVAVDHFLIDAATSCCKVPLLSGAVLLLQLLRILSLSQQTFNSHVALHDYSQGLTT